MPSAAPATLLRLHGLDTLRAAAILIVVIYHLNAQALLPAAFDPIAAIGWCGVDLFFVLSGFLIGSQLLKSFVNTGTLAQRLLRSPRLSHPARVPRRPSPLHHRSTLA